VTSQTTAEPHGQAGFALFDTAIGRCGLAWTGPVISAVRLPGPSDAATCAAVQSCLPGASPVAPPPGIDHVLDRIRNLLAGHCPNALADVPLALSAASLSSAGCTRRPATCSRARPSPMDGSPTGSVLPAPPGPSAEPSAASVSRSSYRATAWWRPADDSAASSLRMDCDEAPTPGHRGAMAPGRCSPLVTDRRPRRQLRRSAGFRWTCTTATSRREEPW